MCSSLTLFVWIGLSVIGFYSIQEMFTDEGFKNIGIIFWMVIMLTMSKYIQHPKVYYREE